MLVPANTDYTDKDYDSLRFRLRNLIRSVFPEWTEFNVANFGNIIIELFAHVGDTLVFYQDGQARQSRITTATQRKALLGLVKLVNFTPSTATPATADVTLTLSSGVTPGTVTFPAGSFVSTEDTVSPVRYQLLEEAVMAAAANPPSVTVGFENSEPEEATFVSTGLPNQTFVLPVSPYIDGSAMVMAGNGTFTQVDNLLSSLPSDKHFTVVVDQNDRATIRTGNGINGAIPVGNVEVPYKVGGGSAGRVDAAKLKVLEGTFIDSLGNPVTVTASNALASSGGADRQSIAQIKERAPASVRAIRTSVAKEDFELNALRLPDVARALFLTSNEDDSIAENAGILYAIPVGGGALSTDLKAAILTQVTVTYPCTLTFSVDVRTAVYKTLDIFLVAYFRPGVSKPVAAAAIRANLAALFVVQNADGTSNTNVDFGGNIKNADGTLASEIAFSDVFNAVRDTTGIRKVGPADADFLINDEHDDVALATHEFPVLGTVTIRDGDTGGSF